jgi:hypothetical protein
LVNGLTGVQPPEQVDPKRCLANGEHIDKSKEMDFPEFLHYYIKQSL